MVSRTIIIWTTSICGQLTTQCSRDPIIVITTVLQCFSHHASVFILRQDLQQQNNETNQCYNHVDLCEKSCNSQIEHVFHRATLGEVGNDASLQSTLQRLKDINRTTNTGNNNVTESNQKSIFIDDLPGQTTYCTGYEEQCNAVGNSNN